MERTPDRKQVKLQSFSKDSDINIRILLDISPRGSTTPKFKYAGDLDELGKKSQERGSANHNKVWEAMKNGAWMTAPLIAAATGLANSTVQGHLKKLMSERKVEDNGMDGRYRAYHAIADFKPGDSIGDSALEHN